MKKSFHRNVSPLERVFILLHEMDKPFSNQVVLEGTGTFDEAHWEKAVEAACEANPGSRLVYSGCSGWAKWLDSGMAAPIRKFEGTQWDAYGPEGAPFLSEPLPFKSTHSCEVVLVGGDLPRVVFRTLHATMDGRGTLVWMEDIFRALRGDPLIGASSTINDAELIARLSKPKKWERKTRTCFAPTGAIDGDEPGNTWRRVRLKGKFSKLLPQAAIAIARETRKQGPNDVCFNIPVDLRRWVPDVRSTVNLTRRIILHVSPEDTVESVQQQMMEKLDNMSREPRILNLIGYVPLGWINFFFTRIRKKNLKSGFYYSTGSISNLGKLSIETFRGGGFEAKTGFFIPPGTEGKPMFMTLAGCGDAVEVIVSMPKTLATNGRLDQFLSHIIPELKPKQ